jgi:septum formation protein
VKRSPHDFIWLASQSPRRRQLLEQIGVRYQLLLADASEDVEALEAERRGEAPEDYVRRVTVAKLAAAQRRIAARALPRVPILCADTTVVRGRAILGKPRDAADATAMLERLSGRTHRVLSAVAVGAGRDRRAKSALSVSRVRFAVLDRAWIARYVASGEPFGKAGAYAIQGAIAAHVERIEGSYSGIMGLPLYETAQLLAKAGVRTT